MKSQVVILYDGEGRALSVQRRYAGAFDGSGSGRRTKSWNASSEDINSVTYTDVDVLRARCRDTVRKNPWAENALNSYVSNVVGVGIQPQSQHKNPEIRSQIHEAFLRWTDEADASSLNDFYGLQRLACRSMREGGECFVRLRYRRPEDGLSVPLQLQLLEAEHLPTYSKPSTLPMGNNTILMGIEKNAIDQRVAYHLHREHPGSMAFSTGISETSRVPADQVLHLFEQLRPGQLRGLPWFTSVLLDLWELRQYTDAQLVKQKVSAMFVGILRRASLADQEPMDLTNKIGMTAEAELQPGTYQTLLPGEEMSFSDPPDAGSFSEFVRAQLRGIAAGLGITYEMLTGDLTSVNYSSIRAGLVEFRRRCEAFQHQIMVHQFCRPVFVAWLRTAVLSGALNLPGYAENPYQYEKVRWMPPGFDWVDPLKDVKAKIMEVRAGFASRAGTVSEKGDDIEQIDRENQMDNARADALELQYDSDGRQPEAEQSKTETASALNQLHQDEIRLEESRGTTLQ